MASGQASNGTVASATGATGVDDGWKTVSGPAGGGDDGWKTVSGPEPEATATKPKLSDRAKDKAKHSLTGGLSHEERAAQPKGYSMGEMASDAYSGPLAVMGLEGVGAAGAGLVKAGGQLLKGSVGPALQAARPALGLIAGFGTGYGVDRAARALGAPGWVAESIATLAAIEVGGKVGMSPEMTARLKNSGFKGIIERWINGEPKPNEVNEFYKAKYGKLPETGEEILTAKTEAADFKKQVAAKLKAARDPEVQKAAKIKESADQYRAERGPLPERKPIEAKLADIPEGPDVKHTAPEPGRRPAPPARKPTLKERTAGRVPLYAQEGVQPADIPEGTREPTAAPDTRTTKDKIEAGRRKRAEAKPEGGTGGNGSNYGFTHPKESLTDVRKQLFSNTQQQQIPNDQVRVRFTQLHGHGISAGTYEEIQQFNEYIAKNGKLPDAPGVK